MLLIYYLRRLTDLIVTGRPTPELKLVQKTKLLKGISTPPQYPWMTRSTKEQKLYCWDCLIFGTESGSWAKYGFSDFLISAASLQSELIDCEENLALKEADCDAPTFWTQMVTAANFSLLGHSHNVWLNLHLQSLHSHEDTCISVSVWQSFKVLATN